MAPVNFVNLFRLLRIQMNRPCRRMPKQSISTSSSGVKMNRPQPVLVLLDHRHSDDIAAVAGEGARAAALEGLAIGPAFAPRLRPIEAQAPAGYSPVSIERPPAEAGTHQAVFAKAKRRHLAIGRRHPEGPAGKIAGGS